jgi:hypothetical protein
MSAPNVGWFLLGCAADYSDVDQENNPASQKTKKFSLPVLQINFFANTFSGHSKQPSVTTYT